ncbi:MAG: FAD-binding protein, partial [Ramlibacter sp.]
PVQPFVRVRHQVLRDPGAFFAAMAQACAGDADFVEGVVFGARDLVLSTAGFVAETPWRSGPRGAHDWRDSLRARDEDFLAVRDWLGRWDEDAAAALGLRDHLQEGWAHWRGRYRERVVQDVAIPMSHAPQFAAFLMDELGSEPAWVCPLRAALPGCDFPLYPLRSDEPSVNFGVRAAVETREPHAAGHFGRRLEQETARLGGLGSLDAGCSLAPDDFDEAYDMAAYARLKSRYDPLGRAPHLYAACVRRD